MKDNFMYKFDDIKGQFVLSTKDEVINTLIDNRNYNNNINNINKLKLIIRIDNHYQEILLGIHLRVYTIYY